MKTGLEFKADIVRKIREEMDNIPFHLDDDPAEQKIKVGLHQGLAKAIEIIRNTPTLISD